MVDIATKSILQTMKFSKDVISFAFSPNGNQLLATSRDGTAKMIDINTGYTLLNIKRDPCWNDVRFSSEGKRAVITPSFGPR